MHPSGLEPETTVPKTVVISISPRVQWLNNTMLWPKNQGHSRNIYYKRKSIYTWKCLRAWFSGRTRPCQGRDRSSILLARTRHKRPGLCLAFCVSSGGAKWVICFTHVENRKAELCFSSRKNKRARVVKISKRRFWNYSWPILLARLGLPKMWDISLPPLTLPISRETF